MVMIRVKLKRTITTECESEPKLGKKIVGKSLLKIKTSNNPQVSLAKPSNTTSSYCTLTNPAPTTRTSLNYLGVKPLGGKRRRKIKGHFTFP